MLKIQRIFLTKTPAAFVIRKSKQWSPPGFEGIKLYDAIKFLFAQLKTHGFTERAAAISYNLIMAVPPSLLFLFTLIPNLPFISKRSIKIQLHTLIRDIIPSPEYNRGVMQFVDSFLDDSRIGLLSFGLILSLFFASNAMMGIIRTFNRKYVGFERINGLEKRWRAIKLTMLIFLLLFIYLLLLIMQGALLKMIVVDKSWQDFIKYFRWGMIVALLFLIIGFIFKYAPAVSKRWKLISPGSVLTTVLCILASVGFAAFVSSFGRYNALYGSIGTIMMVMALIFINSLALLIGFELNVSIRSLKAAALQKEMEEKHAAEGLGKNQPDDSPFK
ncbi:MAG: YihY/virulence factor BrkB family protein [Sphingobacteriales bacterium]|nr:MAG: YihY/virulence factor BrkB family protein [Sphingobacteriales bacterium]